MYLYAIVILAVRRTFGTRHDSTHSMSGCPTLMPCLLTLLILTVAYLYYNFPYRLFVRINPLPSDS